MTMYITDHSIISFNFNYPQHLAHLIKTPIIKLMDIDDLKAKLVTSISPKVVHKNVDLTDTPHWEYLNGNKKPYQKYLADYGEAVGLEHSVKNFNKLIKNFEYLDKKHNKDYIICEKEDGQYVIRDGLHRASLLKFNGYQSIPVVILDCKDEQQLKVYYDDYKDTFLEWYTPIQFTDDCIAHERTYPHYIERPEYLSNKERGDAKWNYIIKHNLPDLKGKTVCDVGCNVGLFTCYMAQMGAKKIDGYDRSESIVQPTNVNLPKQNVVQQAYFVKNMFQLKNKCTYPNLNYHEFNITTADFTKFKYDVFMSTCVLYHFGELFDKFINDISKHNKFVLLQTNLGHGGSLGQYASVEYHVNLLNKYGYHTKVDAPANYKYPVITGEKL